MRRTTRDDAQSVNHRPTPTVTSHVCTVRLPHQAPLQLRVRLPVGLIAGTCFTSSVGSFPPRAAAIRSPAERKHTALSTPFLPQEDTGRPHPAHDPSPPLSAAAPSNISMHYFTAADNRHVDAAVAETDCAELGRSVRVADRRRCMHGASTEEEAAAAAAGGGGGLMLLMLYSTHTDRALAVSASGSHHHRVTRSFYTHILTY